MYLNGDSRSITATHGIGSGMYRMYLNGDSRSITAAFAWRGLLNICGRILPMPGSFCEKSSNDWNFLRRFFQSLELFADFPPAGRAEIKIVLI